MSNKFKDKSIVPTNKSKEKMKRYEELWSKIEDLIRSITKNSDSFDEKYMKIKFNSDGKIPLNKTIQINSIIIVVRATFMKITNVINKFSWMNACINYE